MSVDTTIQPKARKQRNNNAITVKQLMAKKHKVMEFTGKWAAAIGCPEWKGSWSVKGDSSQGKSHFVMQLVQYLANEFGPVFYNSIEEEDSLSFKQRVVQYKLDECRHKVLIGKNESLLELRERLNKRNAPRIVVLDSITFFNKDGSALKLVDTKDYTKLLTDYPDTLFISVLHEDSGKLTSRTAQNVERISPVKLRVEGYRLFVKASRYGGGQSFDVWPEGAAEYWQFTKTKTTTP